MGVATVSVLGLLTGAQAGATGAASPHTPDLPGTHVKLVSFATGLVKPIAMAWRTGDPRMYVAEQGGTVRVVFDHHVVATALTITPSCCGERGLLGLTFSADGKKMYIDYTDTAGNTQVDEYTMSGPAAVPSSRRHIISVTQPYANHNGGEVTIGPDHMLYIGLGDGGGAGDPQGNGQKLSSLLGKILRIDPTPSAGSPYRIPADNPFVGRAAARHEIWMYGLRNPWRWSFDKATGDMWIGDVGQALYEEVDYAPSGMTGTNWGWSIREGFHQYKGAKPPGARDPVIEQPHSAGNCAIIGGYLYRGTNIPKLTGSYVYTDLCTGKLWGLVQSGGAATQSQDLGVTVNGPISFGELPSGELLVASQYGTIYRLVPA